METENKFLVGLLDESVLVSGLTPRRLTREEALNLAAWLLAIADAPHAFEHVAVRVGENADGSTRVAVLSAEFVELLGRVQQS